MWQFVRLRVVRFLKNERAGPSRLNSNPLAPERVELMSRVDSVEADAVRKLSSLAIEWWSFPV